MSEDFVTLVVVAEDHAPMAELALSAFDALGAFGVIEQGEIVQGEGGGSGHGGGYVIKR